MGPLERKAIDFICEGIEGPDREKCEKLASESLFVASARLGDAVNELKQAIRNSLPTWLRRFF